MAQPRPPEATNNSGVSQMAGEVSLLLPSPPSLSLLLDRWCSSVRKAVLVRLSSCRLSGSLVRDGPVGDCPAPSISHAKSESRRARWLILPVPIYEILPFEALLPLRWSRGVSWLAFSL